MIDKINIRQIISDHVRTLRARGEERVSTEDLVVFFGVPLLAGALYLVFSGTLPADNKIDEILVAAFSIFAALMLNIQVFLLGFSLPPPPQNLSEMGAEDRALAETKAEMRQTFFTELFANISYAILLATAIVFLTLVAIFCQVHQAKAVKVIQFAFIMHFALTLLMVMKRVNVLFVALKKN